MAYTTIPTNPFTVPGTAAGFLDIRKKNTTAPVVTVAVPAYAGTTPLAAPANLHQTGSTATSVTMAWDAVANATGYRLRRNGSIILLPGTALTYTDTGLTSGATPSYDVQAIGGNGYGDSAYSAAVQAATTGGTGATAPQLQSLTVEQNSPRLITAAFNKALDPAIVPVAGDFSLSSTHRVLGEPLPVYAGEFVASGYYAPASTGVSLSSGTSTYLLNNDGRGIMFWGGTVTKMGFYCPAYAPGARVYVLLAGQQVEVTSQLTFGQVNTVTLPTPITAGVTERPGLFVTNDTLQLGFEVAPGGGGGGGCTYGATSAMGTTDYDHYVSIECTVTSAPYFGVIGDSIIAGFSANTPTPMGARLVGPSLAGGLAAVLRCNYVDMSWSGQTTTQMLARFNRDIIAKRPRYCFIEGGYNNLYPAAVIADLTEMGQRCITAGIIPIFTGSAPNGAPGVAYSSKLQDLADVTTGVKNFVNAQAPGTALFMDFGPILGDPGPVNPTNPGAGPVHYAYKAAYYSNDPIHPNQDGARALAVAATDFILKHTPASIVGSNLLLKVDRNFVLSDAPVSLSFSGATKHIQSTDGGMVASLSNQPITLNIAPAAETLNFVGTGQNQHFRADKCFPTGVGGYVEYNPISGNAYVLAISPEYLLLSAFRQGTAWIDNPGHGVGLLVNGNTTGSTTSGSLQYVKNYYRLVISPSHLATLLGSDDGVTYTQIPGQTQLSQGALYIFGLGGSAGTKALGVAAYPGPGSYTDTGANYTGAVAPVDLTELTGDSRKMAFNGQWTGNTGQSGGQTGDVYYALNGANVTMRGRGRGFALKAIKDDAIWQVSVNGATPYAVPNNVDNPTTPGTYWEFYTSPLSSTAQEMEITITGLFLFNGIHWID